MPVATGALVAGRVGRNVLFKRAWRNAAGTLYFATHRQGFAQVVGVPGPGTKQRWLAKTYDFCNGF